jgi:hypothetical protein
VNGIIIEHSTTVSVIVSRSYSKLLRAKKKTPTAIQQGALPAKLSSYHPVVNGIIIEHFVAKGVVKGSSMIN